MYQATQKQINLLNNRVRVWFNPTCFDCYTVAIKYQRDGQIVWDIYGMSANGRGFNQYSHTHYRNTYKMDKPDKRIKWSNTPLELVNAILNRV